LIHQVRILHDCGCNFFQRTRNALRCLAQSPELFVVKKVRPQRNADGPFAVEQPLFTHGAAQFFENDR
jgi:hypothetical protein